MKSWGTRWWGISSVIFVAIAGSSSAQATVASLSDTYRLGDEWGKKPVTAEVLRTATPVFKRTAQATARVGGGTGFYLGKFAGQHVVATNHHVCPAAWECLGNRAQFVHLGNRSFKVTKYFGTWSDVDLTLLGIEVTNEGDAAALASVAANFDFSAELYPDEKLLTIGFGSGSNPTRAMVANQDSDCKVFSARGDYHFMGDPDALNPGPYKAWSFANGCDVSHGDSGSAMVDRETGHVIGIIWTGKIPKSAMVQSSAFLDQLLARGGDEIWSELSYGVPAAKIGEHLDRVADDTGTEESTREMLKELLRR